MWSLFRKEVFGFLSSLVGFIVMAIFLLITGLFIWVFPGDLNILQSGYADMVPFFTIAPWVFMFLIPAITMKFFAEEKRTGTIETLLTKPITENQIILGKLLAGLLLVAIALLPTWLYYSTVFNLAVPVGNIDKGGITGAYLGLFLLSMAFVAIGTFSSTLSSNQIISFIVAVFLCFFFFTGFDAIGSFEFFGSWDYVISALGINEHYRSLGRGVMDTRDVVYLISISVFFFLLAKVVLESRKAKKVNSLITVFSGIILLIAIQLLNTMFFSRVDLTTEKRFTLREETKDLLSGLEEQMLVRVYLEGEFPADIRRLKTATQDILEEFRAYAKGNLHYSFINPSESSVLEERERNWRELTDAGLQYTNITIRGKDGVEEKIIFPGAIIAYNGIEIPVQLLRSSVRTPSAEMVNGSINDLEYNLISAVQKAISPEKRRVAVLQGNGEIAGLELGDLVKILSDQYEVNLLDIDGKYTRLIEYDALIVPGPSEKVSEEDKYIIDQFIMLGKPAMFLVDGIRANMDSLQRSGGSQILGEALDVNLDDMFFNYGVRLNKNVLMDQMCAPIALNVGQMGDRVNLQLFPWYFFPTLLNPGDHPVSRNVGPILTKFISSLDTLQNKEVSKTILWYTSPLTRKLMSPARISLNIVGIDPGFQQLSVGPQPVAVLLKGKFNSLFANRIAPKIADASGIGTIKQCINENKVIVIGDADLVRNKINREKNIIYPLSYDPFAKKNIYGNRDFILNCMNYLMGDASLIEVRSRKITLRKLDNNKVLRLKSGIQFSVLFYPVLAIALFCLAFAYLRKRKYASRVLKASNS